MILFPNLVAITAAGGVAFYIKKSFKYTFRKEISTSVTDYEALWLEIVADGQRNIVCGVIYRHLMVILIILWIM